METNDVVIVGGGPAGLSAALVLGRCRRVVTVIDNCSPRNGASPALHAFLTRDGTNPWHLRELGEAELQRYPSVKLARVSAHRIQRGPRGFQVSLSDGRELTAKFVLLATGRVDPVPSVKGADAFFAKGVYHCPYCDGWEHRDQALGVIGSTQSAAELARELLTWSNNVTLYTDGEPCEGGELEPLLGTKIEVVSRPILHLDGNEKLERICFAEGDSARCDALFFCTDCRQHSDLPEGLGCELDDESSVVCDGHQARHVPGLYVAGNVRGGVHLAITAAAEGAEAAIAINEALLGFEPSDPATPHSTNEP